MPGLLRFDPCPSVPSVSLSVENKGHGQNQNGTDPTDVVKDSSRKVLLFLGLNVRVELPSIPGPVGVLESSFRECSIHRVTPRLVPIRRTAKRTIERQRMLRLLEIRRNRELGERLEILH